MLKELYIENLAIIEKATVQFLNGFNVFTGETGAGKSILIGAIGAVTGARTSKEFVGNCAEKSVITAVFTDVDGADPEDGQLIITREIYKDGGSTAKIGGRPVNVSQLREIGEKLIVVHGQHDNTILLNPKNHLAIIDGIMGGDYLSDYQDSFKQLQICAKKLTVLKETTNPALREEIDDSIKEITALKLKKDENFEEIYRNACNAEETLTALLTAKYGLDTDNLKDARGILNDIDENLAQRLSEAIIEIEDIADELSARAGRIDLNEEQMERLKTRYSAIMRATRRFGTDSDGLLDLLDDFRQKLWEIDNLESEVELLLDERAELLKTASEKAKILSKKRIETAENFSKQVAEQLGQLNMPGVTFTFSHSTGKLTSGGMDEFEFLISANKGQEPRPIAKIASGGELSRIMLALMSVCNGDVPTLIFDEIDTGVSGETANRIAEKITNISKSHQVICVTHLPQIAAAASNHFHISKAETGTGVKTIVKNLEKNERIYEIARIIGGDNPSEAALKSAEEIIKSYKY